MREFSWSGEDQNIGVYITLYNILYVSIHHDGGISLCRYATVYTMAPVFSLVLDEDVSADIALMYPELYRDLMKVHIRMYDHFNLTRWV